MGLNGELNSKQFFELPKAQSCVPNYPRHGERVDRIFSRYGDNRFAIGHYDMFPFSRYPKTGFFKSTNGSDMAYAGEFWHYCLISTYREIFPFANSSAVLR